MITLRRSGQRHRTLHRRQTVWLTFYPRDRQDPRADGFGVLESLGESRLPPGARIEPQLYFEVEVLTYVRQGSLVFEDSADGSGVIQAGELQRTTATAAVRRSGRNASPTHWAHFFQIWLWPTRDGLTPGQEQKRFSVAERRGALRLIASPDARRGSLGIHQDALIYSALLEPGRHLIHELPRGRSAWLHIVQGEARLGDVVLGTGDGAGLTAERLVSLTANEETEILLVDVGEPPPPPPPRPGGR